MIVFHTPLHCSKGAVRHFTCYLGYLIQQRTRQGKFSWSCCGSEKAEAFT